MTKLCDFHIQSTKLDWEHKIRRRNFIDHKDEGLWARAHSCRMYIHRNNHQREENVGIEKKKRVSITRTHRVCMISGEKSSILETYGKIATATNLIINISQFDPRHFDNLTMSF